MQPAVLKGHDLSRADEGLKKITGL
jgi:hypothetical protein